MAEHAMILMSAKLLVAIETPSVTTLKALLPVSAIQVSTATASAAQLIQCVRKLHASDTERQPWQPRLPVDMASSGHAHR
ncbi:hypothetical protein PHYPO_G00023110 [Pangasianodon hypophthalmus]|uniref:Uncharacterized protein n=1 Tax=Pangasianodon hypophthalmus TaxID=310915 RepID=A0A5N5MVJ7_PANHP|nr:hypothetical protein PHYPO_G00023110 [Pangasianodon hypophthalmus]